MKAFYPILGRITWMIAKRQAKQKLPTATAPTGKKKIVAGAATALLTIGAVAALRRRGNDRLI